MLDLSRIDAGLPLDIRDTDVAAVVDAEVQRTLMLAPQVTVVRTGLTELNIAADPTRVAQVLSNLLDNARRYTPAGGSITVDLSTGGGMAAVTVTDTGPGIPTTSDIASSSGWSAGRRPRPRPWRRRPGPIDRAGARPGPRRRAGVSAARRRSAVPAQPARGLAGRKSGGPVDDGEIPGVEPGLHQLGDREGGGRPAPRIRSLGRPPRMWMPTAVRCRHVG